MATLLRTERMVARSLAETADPDDALARALRAIGESLEWRFGAVWEPAADRPEALRCVETWHAVGVDAQEFEAASGQRRAGLDCRRAGRRQLSARPGGAPGRAARRLLLPRHECQRRPGRDRAVQRRGPRARSRAARHHGRPGRPDRPGRGAPPRRRGAAREGGTSPRHARCGARLRGDHGPRWPGGRFQPGRRELLRLPGIRRVRPRHGRPDHPAGAARASPPRS